MSMSVGARRVSRPALLLAGRPLSRWLSPLHASPARTHSVSVARGVISPTTSPSPSCASNASLHLAAGSYSFGRPHFHQSNSLATSSSSSSSSTTPIPAPPSSTPLPSLPLLLTRSFVQLRTNLQVADNSGAKRVQCIKVLRGKGPNAAGLGDTIIASVKDAEPRGKVKKGDVVTCIVVRAATSSKRSDGSGVRFDGPAAVIVSKAGEPVGTRVFGPVPHELRRRKMLKLITLAKHVI